MKILTSARQAAVKSRPVLREGTEAAMKMLILRGIAGHYAGRDWPRGALDELKWSRLSEQIFRIDKWSLCQG